MACMRILLAQSLLVVYVTSTGLFGLYACQSFWLNLHSFVSFVP